MQNQSDRRNHYVLLHGFGNGPSEVSRIHEWLADQGQSVAAPCLPYHSSPEEFKKFDIFDFERRVLKLVEREILEHKDFSIILIANSLSAAVVMSDEGLLSKLHFIAISPFLGLPAFQKNVLNFAYWIAPNYNFRRKQARNSPRTDFISDRFCVSVVKKIDNWAVALRSKNIHFGENCLVLQSFHDTVSAYSHSREVFNRRRAQSEFVTLLGAPHSVCRNLDPNSLAHLIDTHFFESEITNKDSSARDSTIEGIYQQYAQLNEEHRNWAGKVYNLIVGFFTAFSVLVFQTLGDVLDNSPRAPYYLMSYATLIFLYVLVTSLYFYYLNRTQSYIVNYIEPAMPGLGFQQYKLFRNFSGTESTTLTFNTSFTIIVMPFILATIATIYGIITYPDRFLIFQPKNIMLQSWLFINFVLYTFSQINALKLARSTSKTIYAPPVPEYRSVKKLNAISSLLFRANYRS